MHDIVHVGEGEVPAGACTPAVQVDAAERHLAPGYYVVVCLKSGRGARRGKRYFGPFATSAVACMLQVSLVALGLAPDKPRLGAVAGCATCRRGCAGYRHTGSQNSCPAVFPGVAAEPSIHQARSG